MYQKFIRTAALAITGAVAFSSSSCDTAEGVDNSNVLTNPNRTVQSFASPRSGDILTYTSSDPAQLAFIPQITLRGNETTILGSTYIYSKTGEHTFDINISFSGADNLNQAVAQLLGADTPLGFRFRELILRADPVFTAQETLELFNLLNPNGADVSITPRFPTRLNSISTRRYENRLTSTNIDQQRGTMGGLYQVRETSFVIGFRAPFQSELDNFRLLTPQHQIPFVTTEQNLNIVAEQGNFVLDLTTR